MTDEELESGEPDADKLMNEIESNIWDQMEKLDSVDDELEKVKEIMGEAPVKSKIERLAELSGKDKEKLKKEISDRFSV